jgi:broad specificity phosphatase PhoE
MSVSTLCPSADASHLLLIRHAASDCTLNGQTLLCGSYDAPVSSAGRAEIERLSARLASDPATALYSSSLQRAILTADAAPPALRARMRVLRSLAEVNCGLLDGLAIESVRRDHAAIWAENEAQTNPDFRWPGGETYKHFRRRVLRTVRAIARKHPGERVLVVTHAGVINQILGTIAAQSAARWENFRPGNATITEVIWKGDTGRVAAFDDRSHLL